MFEHNNCEAITTCILNVTNNAKFYKYVELNVLIG